MATPRGGVAATGGASRRVRASAPAVRVPELVIGVILVVGCALAAMVWHRSVTAGTTVVAAATDLPRGHVITAADLSPAEVRSAEVLGLVPGERAEELLGSVVLVDVGAGEPVLQSMVSAVMPLRRDEGLASVAVGRGQAPSELAPGDAVRVVVVPVADPLTGSTPEMLEVVAEVWSVEPATEYDALAVITLRLPLEQAAGVTAADSVRLVRVEG